MQGLLPPVAHDVLRDHHGQHVRGRYGGQFLDVRQDRAHHLAVGRVEDLQRQPGVVLLPRAAQPGRLRLVGGDRHRRQGVGAQPLRVADGLERRGVHGGDQDDHVVTGRLARSGVGGDVDLPGHLVVVAAHALHAEEEQGHRDDDQPGPVRELGEEDDDEDQGGHGGADRVDGEPAVDVDPLLARGGG